MRTFVGATCLILAGVILGGCSKAGPTVLGAEVIANPSGRAPLTALCRIQTAEPSVPVVTVNNGRDTFTVPVAEEYATEHDVPILKLRPGTTNTITVAVRGENGGLTTAGEETVTTAALPERFPPIEVTMAKPEKMEPGFQLIPFMGWPNGVLNSNWGLLVAIDETGEVLWYLDLKHTIEEPKRLESGNFVFSRGREGNMYEYDMLGNIVRQWHSTGVPKDAPDEGSIPVDIDTIHHDFTILPNGNFIVLSTEARHYDDYPVSETDISKRAAANVIGDVVAEITPEGEVVRQIKLLDILDPLRLSYDSLQTFFWVGIYKDEVQPPGKDWSHTNSVEYDASDDSVILSMYHQDAVVKLDMDTGAIKWILGDHERWEDPWSQYLLTPVDEDFEWNYHQHSAKLTPEGTLIMYDNGLYRAIPPKAKMDAVDSYSRAVEFRIDEENMTVEQLWHYGGPDGERFFAPFISEVDLLPETGNILVTNGGLVKNADGTPSAQIMGGQHWATIMEVTHTDPPEKVFEVVIDDEAPDGWAVYRSQRFASLY